MSKERYIIAINTGEYWNVRGGQAEAESSLDWLMHVGSVTAEDEPEIIRLDDESED